MRLPLVLEAHRWVICDGELGVHERTDRVDEFLRTLKLLEEPKALLLADHAFLYRYECVKNCEWGGGYLLELVSLRDLAVIALEAIRRLSNGQLHQALPFRRETVAVGVAVLLAVGALHHSHAYKSKLRGGGRWWAKQPSSSR